ncbi:bile acid:sodium symporter [Marinobacterium jannaschii]|uniref:bile acid:sodium symporter n=1 Tax=Marinobacterium jannaschii TaxID=64970 RepID=UPI00055E5C9A|nr:bile acid:sodium symporter [Marinobacterium jannaschii]
MKSAFLPSGLLVAFAIAYVAPEAGTLLKQIGLIPWMVATIFLVNGYQTNLKELPRESVFIKATLAAGVISLLIGPLLGAATASLLGFGAGMTLGLVVKSTVPSTLSTCIVMTQLCGGRSLWALVMTVILNIVGIFTLPFMLALTLSQSGDISISPLPLLLTLLKLVLLPFIVGAALRTLLSLSPQSLALQYLPSLCVIVTVWMAMSDSAEVLRQIEGADLIKIALATLIIHFGLMLLCWLAAKAIQLDWSVTLALLFTGSQKTLPVAVSVLTALNQALGEALLVCVLFHFLILFSDSLLLPKLKRPETQTG